MTGQNTDTAQAAETTLAARDAGADLAEVIVRGQIEAGATQIELSAPRALADWLNHPTDASKAFCQGYTQVAQAYVDAATEYDLEAEQEAAG
jgi:hypothetical protein